MVNDLISEFEEEIINLPFRKRIITCPKCKVTMIQQTPVDESVDDKMDISCSHCGVGLHVISSQQEKKCVHCGERNHIGREGKFILDVELCVELSEGPFTLDRFKQELYEQVQFNEIIEELIDTEQFIIKVDDVNKCTYCGKYQTADGEAPKEVTLSEIEEPEMVTVVQQTEKGVEVSTAVKSVKCPKCGSTKISGKGDDQVYCEECGWTS